MALGRGKVILFGEHAVVYGRPAVAAALSRGVTAVAETASRTELYVAPWNLRLDLDSPADPAHRSLAKAFRVAIEDAQVFASTTPVSVSAQVDLPASAGLGCSAALGVAVMGALDERNHRPRTPEQRADAALAWETVFHGNPSGIDNWMAACGGLALYRKGSRPEALRLERPLRLVVGHSGEPGSTKEMVRSVADQQKRDPTKMEKVLDGIESIVEQGRLAVERGELAPLGQLMQLNQTLLSAILVSTERLERLCRAAIGAGAYGAKLTGGGGGGCMIALVDSDSEASVVSALHELGADPFVSEVTA